MTCSMACHYVINFQRCLYVRLLSMAIFTSLNIIIVKIIILAGEVYYRMLKVTNQKWSMNSCAQVFISPLIYVQVNNRILPLSGFKIWNIKVVFNYKTSDLSPNFLNYYFKFIPFSVINYLSELPDIYDFTFDNPEENFTLWFFEEIFTSTE